ncbi:MAG TPA: hypothetical protein VF175_19185 [Lacipirellula sp.]
MAGAGTSEVVNASGFALTDAVSFDAATTWTGKIRLDLFGGRWAIEAHGSPAPGMWYAYGAKTLSGPITQLRFTTAAARPL